MHRIITVEGIQKTVFGAGRHRSNRPSAGQFPRPGAPRDGSAAREVRRSPAGPPGILKGSRVTAFTYGEITPEPDPCWRRGAELARKEQVPA